MALSIRIDPRNTGSPATYWVISSMNIDFIANKAFVSVSGWTDQTSHDNGLSCLISIDLNTTGAANPLTKASLAGALTNLQNWLVANSPQFIGAQIVA